MKKPQDYLKRCEGNFRNCTDYDDAIEAMEAYANQSRWISVEERLPEIGQKVLVYRPMASRTADEPCVMSIYSGISYHSPQQIEHKFDCWCHPTHWRVIEYPSAPREEEQK